MKLSELLSELRENILHDRSDRTDGDEDLLWSDTTLVRYINEACRRFARQGLVIHDNRSEASEVTLIEGQTEYTLHPSVLAVRSAKLVGERRDLQRTGHSALDAYITPTTQFWDPAHFSELPPGKPLAYTTDESIGPDDDDSAGATMLRVYPAPTAEYADQIIKLRLIRLPLEHLTLDNVEAIPEIPEAHHMDMLDWAAYLALRIADVDMGDLKRSQIHRASFEEHVKEAKQVAMRKLFAPTGWAFGQNGFSWEP
jgi:hypothetical protein